MLVVLYPLSNKVWNRLSADEFDRNEVSSSSTEVQVCTLFFLFSSRENLCDINLLLFVICFLSSLTLCIVYLSLQTDAMIASRKWALPKQDINAPDLYIPLMSFVTYVLLYGFLRGISSPESAANSFSPDILAQSIWRCLILQLLEAGGLKFGANILSIHVPFLDCYAIAGYKYVALCVNTLARFLNGTLAVIVSFYTAIMLAYFALKTTAIAIPPPPSSDGSNSNAPSPRLIVILGFGVAQLLLTLFMSLF